MFIQLTNERQTKEKKKTETRKWIGIPRYLQLQLKGKQKRAPHRPREGGVRWKKGESRKWKNLADLYLNQAGDLCSS
jgi:hypothetical protein